MIWEQHCLVIVMTTRVMERGRVKCGQYWEPQENSSLEFGNFHVRTLSIETNEDYTIASLELRNTKVSLVRLLRLNRRILLLFVKNNNSNYLH